MTASRSPCWTPGWTPPTRTWPAASWRPPASSPARTSSTATATAPTPPPPSPAPAPPPAGRKRASPPAPTCSIGKVLGDDGSGSSTRGSSRAWSGRRGPARQGGQHEPGPAAWHTQDDPLSQAVNKLSAETGALFVVAAGNSGNSPYTVSAPGTADAALTVGAVDSSDAPRPVLQRGPAVERRRPQARHDRTGVDVLAARSQHVRGRRLLPHRERHLDGGAPRRRGGGPAGPEASGLDRAAAQGRADEHQRAAPPTTPPTRPAPVAWTSPPPT